MLVSDHVSGRACMRARRRAGEPVSERARIIHESYMSMEPQRALARERASQLHAQRALARAPVVSRS